jgi:ankyrin repeat protein
MQVESRIRIEADSIAGQSQFYASPVPAQPLNFNLSIDDPGHDDDQSLQHIEDNDSRLIQMLASQARHRHDNANEDNEENIASNGDLSDEEKRDTLQGILNMAASNGDVDRVKRLVNGSAKRYIDLNASDSEGTPPLIYASCFGHEDVVVALLDAGAKVDIQDRNQWSALMWAMTNRHKGIAKTLLDHGASSEIRSSSGRTAFDFVPPGSEISEYLHESGYIIGNAGVTDDFYSSGFSQDRFEEEMAENEMKRRMMMESAINLEVDLGNLGIDEQPEVRCFVKLTFIADGNSPQAKWKIARNLYGINASRIKCLFSRKAT